MFKTPLTIIIPVFNGFEAVNCLVKSLQENYPNPTPGLRFHFCDDASSDPRISGFYSRNSFFDRSDVQVIENSRNLGYTRNINQAIRQIPKNSAVVLLNSDTMVGPHLFESLHQHGTHDKFLGSISPLSNSATICSLFGWPHGGKNPFEFSPQRISELVQKQKNFHSLIATPTTVGFCMYIPAEAIRITGLFDEKLFARGYGEENDWCLRASAHGLKHYIFTGAYVHHEGGQSFGKEKELLIQKNLKMISRLYPTYNALVESFIQADSFDNLRLSILSHLSEIDRRATGKKLLMFVSHSDPEDRGGGVQTHIRHLSNQLFIHGKLDTIHVFPIHGRWRIRYVSGSKKIWEVTLRNSEVSLHQALLALLPSCVAVHFHHTLHFPKKILDAIFEVRGPKKIVTCHDYFLVCPSINLMGPSKRFCELPSQKSDCTSCLKREYNISDFSMTDYRQESIGLLFRADHILFPSLTAQSIFIEGLSRFATSEYKFLLKEIEKKSSVIEHFLPLKKIRKPSTTVRTRGHSGKKIIFLGGISEPKGLGILQDLVPLLAEQKYQVEIWGKLSEPLRHAKKIKHREYNGIEDLEKLAHLARGAMVVIPSVWPETFCYTAHEALLVLKTPLVAFQIGHPSSLIKKWSVGLTTPTLSARALMKTILKANQQYARLVKNVFLFCDQFPSATKPSLEKYLQIYGGALPFPPQVFKDRAMEILDSNSLITQSDRTLLNSFVTAKPFKYFVLEQFLNTKLCDSLLEQFPSFETGDCRNEAGLVGRKSSRTDLQSLGDAFKKFDNLMKSPEFLRALGEATGIPDLLYDPDYVGGGTHENLSGQDLDYHIDFNHHPKTKYHRRLNLILFLNPEWKMEWGGCLQLSSDPMSRKENLGTDLVTIEPTLNRCVVFETTENSWHGFEKIQIPGDKPSSRKSIAVYFYSETRPLSELGDNHSTVYLNRPLPERFRLGYTLTPEDEVLLQTLIVRRDQHIEYLYKRESQLLSELHNPRSQRASGNESVNSQPLGPHGFVKAITVKNLYEDQWVGPRLEIQALALARFSRLALKGWTPDWSPEPRNISIYCNDQKVKEVSLAPGRFNIEIELPLKKSQLFVLKVECSKSNVPKNLGISEDLRALSWLLDSATFDA